MYPIAKETERLILEADAGDDYDASQELEYWTINDFEDVLPLPQPISHE